MGTVEQEEDWQIECSDDEKYSTVEGLWEPAPEDIKEMYEKLARGEELLLSWNWPRGRRSPSPEPCEEDMDIDSGSKDSTPKQEKLAPTEFDFDDNFSDIPLKAITPRRTPGAKTPRTQKRVARMDKIMDDLRKEKKSMTPGQRTMVPGHRPLPGLGAVRTNPKTGSSPAYSIQRSPGAGGQRSPAGQRSLSPAAGKRSALASGFSGSAQKSSPGSAASEGHKQTLGVAAASSSTLPQAASIPSGGAVNKQTEHSLPLSGDSSVTLFSSPSNEQNKPSQAVTMVHPSPSDGTPQRPALPKLKIRKDLIS